jgi:predicted RND superfamily exporter protein
VLTVIFRQPRWVLLPLVSCFYAGTVMTGMLGLIGWEVTVISSNFLSLMLIITISINIHLVVRYRQLFAEGGDLSNFDLVSATLSKMLWPCLYTSLTTIIGFCSLVLSDIKPVIDFGWMMSVGLGVAFLTSFSLFPVVLMLAGKPSATAVSARDFRFTLRLAGATERHGNAILGAAVVIAIVSAVGISRLTVENSFIDYFSSDTEIYQGMKQIDEKLGGTTPLQVLLNLDPDRHLAEEEPSADGDLEEDDFEDWELDSGPEYWFTPSKIAQIKRVHDYLDSLPEVGKVLSVASAIRVAEGLNDGKEFEGIELSVLYRKLPDEVKGPLIDPYFSYEHDEARILLRILDSKPDLRRGELLARIRNDLEHDLGLGDGDVTLTGTLVLYNNMLQSLYASQISSLGAVTCGIALMLFVLFRSLRLTVIGILPNLLAAGAILGLMGLVGIPLDLMTVTIAAIAIGIAVDNSIHYIYRFREEFEQSGSYIETLYICHGSIGRAVLYTSSTIIFGFSVLVLSNFFPTIYFGALTGLAMLIALLAALTLLPRLILITRPFGPEGSPRSAQ